MAHTFCGLHFQAARAGRLAFLAGLQLQVQHGTDRIEKDEQGKTQSLSGQVTRGVAFGTRYCYKQNAHGSCIALGVSYRFCIDKANNFACPVDVLQEGLRRSLSHVTALTRDWSGRDR